MLFLREAALKLMEHCPHIKQVSSIFSQEESKGVVGAIVSSVSITRSKNVLISMT